MHFESRIDGYLLSFFHVSLGWIEMMRSNIGWDVHFSTSAFQFVICAYHLRFSGGREFRIRVKALYKESDVVLGI